MKLKIKNLNQEGVVVLPTVLILGAIIIGIVITGTLITQVINRSIFGIRLDSETMAAARAAVEEVHLRLIRGDLVLGQECNDLNPIFEKHDTLVLGRGEATIWACKYFCGLEVCGYRVRLEAKATLFVKRRVEAVFDNHPITGQVTLRSVEALGF